MLLHSFLLCYLHYSNMYVCIFLGWAKRGQVKQEFKQQKQTESNLSWVHQRQEKTEHNFDPCTNMYSPHSASTCLDFGWIDKKKQPPSFLQFICFSWCCLKFFHLVVFDKICFFFKVPETTSLWEHLTVLKFTFVLWCNFEEV